MLTHHGGPPRLALTQMGAQRNVQMSSWHLRHQIEIRADLRYALWSQSRFWEENYMRR